MMNKKLVAPILLLAALIPPVYNLLSIQHSALTVPFWDHVELIKFLTAWHDGSFVFSSLWQPHNHTRPLFYRLVMLGNAILTDWDLRSEYIFLYIALWGGFLLHLFALWVIIPLEKKGKLFPTFALLFSIISFSPVGHNNHWWSMMFQLDAANLFMVFSMLLAFLKPRNWAAQICAAIFSWMATYTITNGIFSMVAIFTVCMASKGEKFSFDRFSLFWLINLLIILPVYAIGLPIQNGPHPSGLAVIEFSLAYLGSPIAGLLYFPFKSQFDIPVSTVTNCVFGLFATTIGIYACYKSRKFSGRGAVVSRITLGFFIFALVSALATAWGRAAFDQYGVSNANASRYSIFSGYLTFGVLYFIVYGLSIDLWRSFYKSIIYLLITIFILLSAISYVRAVVIYKEAHIFNKNLSTAYQDNLQPTEYDQFIHPNPSMVEHLKAELLRLGYGPFRTVLTKKTVFPVRAFKEAFPLMNNFSISQSFRSPSSRLRRACITLVTYGNKNNGGISWSLSNSKTGKTISSGVIAADKISDWGESCVDFVPIKDSKDADYKFTLTGVESPSSPGVPLYERGENSLSGNVIILRSSHAQEISHLSMKLKLEYL
jgi:hypothetical protein